jgi:hypothetical protein
VPLAFGLTSRATTCSSGGAYGGLLPRPGLPQASMVDGICVGSGGAWGGRGTSILGCFAAIVESASICERLRAERAFAVSVTHHAVRAGAGARGLPSLSCL